LWLDKSWERTLVLVFERLVTSIPIVSDENKEETSSSKLLCTFIEKFSNKIHLIFFLIFVKKMNFLEEN
jgi:hypothetical protein